MKTSTSKVLHRMGCVAGIALIAILAKLDELAS